MRLFSTFFFCRAISLALSRAKMWEHTDLEGPDQVLLAEAPDSTLWARLEMVLKVGDQREVEGSEPFNRKDPPNLVSSSVFLDLVDLQAYILILISPCSLGARLSLIPSAPPERGRGCSQAGRPSGRC